MAQLLEKRLADLDRCSSEQKQKGTGEDGIERQFAYDGSHACGADLGWVILYRRSGGLTSALTVFGDHTGASDVFSAVFRCMRN